MVKKVGILGGTFDPIHNGHIRIAQEARKQLNLDMMWIMPAPVPPHKQPGSVTDDVHRLMMTDLSIPDESIEMNVMEFAREGKSYTSDTLTALAKEHPDGEYYYIMGEDSLRDFPKWHEPETIASIAKIAVAVREENRERFEELLSERNRQYKDAFLPLALSYQPVSSTMLRESIKEGVNTDLISPRALSYIHHFGLYGTTATAIRPETQSLYEEFRGKLSKILSPHRLRHCTGVAHLAAEFMLSFEEYTGGTPSADGFFDSVQKAMIAGLLHDCAKYIPESEFVSFCEEHDIPIEDELSRNAPELLHAAVGRYLAETVYGIKDSVILGAIEKHCTGDVGMNPVELAVYTADYCEPFRDHRPLSHSLHEIRMAGYENLYTAARFATECTLQFLEYNHWEAHPKMVQLMEELNQKTEEMKIEKAERKYSMSDYTSKDLAKTAYIALDNKKAFDIRVIEIDKVSTIADYFVIADGNNASQVEAMVDEVQMLIYKKYGVEPKRVEGARNCGWILMDYGDIVVHVFSSQDRLFYDLERVWRDGTTMDTTGWADNGSDEQ